MTIWPVTRVRRTPARLEGRYGAGDARRGCWLPGAGRSARGGARRGRGRPPGLRQTSGELLTRPRGGAPKGAWPPDLAPDRESGVEGKGVGGGGRRNGDRKM